MKNIALRNTYHVETLDFRKARQRAQKRKRLMLIQRIMGLIDIVIATALIPLLYNEDLIPIVVIYTIGIWLLISRDFVFCEGR